VVKVEAEERGALVAVAVPGKAAGVLAKVVAAAKATVRLVAGQAQLAILLAAAGEMRLPQKLKYSWGWALRRYVRKAQHGGQPNAARLSRAVSG
jgi:hypothetical protein